MMLRSVPSAFLLLAIAACSHEPAPAPAPGAPPASTAAARTGVFDVKCGCSIEGIGRCGNYILIDGEYVPMVHPTLGKMEFCAQKERGARVEAAGSMQDGKFVATSWRIAQ